MSEAHRVRLRWPLVATLFRYESRMILRDRRTILLSVLLPLAVMPLVFYATSYAEKARVARLGATEYRYAIAGTEASWARRVITEALALPVEQLEAAEEEERSFRFVEVESTQPHKDVQEELLSLAVEALSRDELLHEWELQDAERDTAQGSEASGDTLPAGGRSEAYSPLPGDDPATPRVAARELRIVFRADIDASRAGKRALERRLLALRETHRQALLADLAEEALYPLDEENIASVGQESGARLGRFLVLFLVMLIMTGGSVVAIDSIAGEKERGSLETLLTTACTRSEIIFAKLLLVLAVALFITLSQVLNLAVYVGLDLFDLPEGFFGAVTPGVALLLALLVLPVAVLAAGVLLLISGRAKTYKEAQLFFFPVYLLSLLPPLAAALPTIHLRSAIVLVPLANVSVAVRELLAGRADMLMLAIVFLLSSAAAIVAVWAAVRTLDKEDAVVAGAMPVPPALGGVALFSRQLAGWYAVAWALILIIPMNFEFLAELRGQVLFNVVLVFLGGSLLLVRRYDLGYVEALSLRTPPPLTWLAVLIGAPSAFVLGVAVFQVSDKLFPAPEKLLEMLSQLILPEQASLVTLLLFVAILPGICEEIAFRGLLLHGLRGRMKPLPAVLISAVVFGVFHQSLFRLIPTAYLGLLLGTLVVLTRSIYPGMLWHVLHNACPVLLTRFDLMPESFSALHYLLAALGLTVSFGIIVFASRRSERRFRE